MCHLGHVIGIAVQVRMIESLWIGIQEEGVGSWEKETEARGRLRVREENGGRDCFLRTGEVIQFFFESRAFAFTLGMFVVFSP